MENINKLKYSNYTKALHNVMEQEKTFYGKGLFDAVCNNFRNLWKFVTLNSTGKRVKSIDLEI